MYKYVLIMLVGVISVSAAEQDPVAAMNRLLATKPAIMSPNVTTREPDDPDPDMPRHGLRFHTVVTYGHPMLATVTNSRVISTTALVFDKTQQVTLPEVVWLQQKHIENCGTDTLQSSVALSITASEGWSVQKTNGLTTTLGVQLTGSMSIQSVGSAGTTLSWQQTISSSTTVGESGSKSVTRSLNDTITVGPNKAIDVSFMAYQSTVQVPFTATVVVDGDIAPNETGVLYASQLLSVAERTLAISGMLTVTGVSDSTVRTIDIPGSVVCPPNGTPHVQIADGFNGSFPLSGMGKYLKQGFAKVSKRSGNLKLAKLAMDLEPIGPTPEPPPPQGPVIGPPDGTSYEILYSVEISKPSAQCGFNDAGVPILGIYNSEARQYRTYANGHLVSQWQDTVDTFSRCYPGP